ncbi:MAG: deoxynucleoside kinase [Nanoarchaeota archaeon]|nr:deoxynucleoside kinase [Nanoarchaeota archaeon]
MLERIAYVTGTHGSGKSTFISAMAGQYPLLCDQVERIPIPKSEVMDERWRIKSARYLLQAFNDRDWELAHPGKIGFRDRCILDNFGYMQGFLELGKVEDGWVTPAQYKEFEESTKILFPSEFMPKNVIFVDAPFDFCVGNIKSRWAVTGVKKWREDKFYYLDAVRVAFQKFFATYPGNVLRLQATDLEERLGLAKGWIESTML